MYGVQSEGSAAIACAWETDTEEVMAVKADTLADSISVDMPADGVRALRAVRETGGRYVTVSDRRILKALGSLGRVGIFSEPAGAAAFAGYMKALE